jgi:predicted RNA-binding protein with PUA-like domain
MPGHWLLKSEPSAYSFDRLAADGKTRWDGVRNFTARNHLREMAEGDTCLFYHSGEGKEVVGVARVVRTAFPDPTAPGEDWSAVEIAPVKPFPKAVTLAEMKADKELADLPMLRLSRLSVSPVSAEQFRRILKLGKCTL